MYTRHVVTEMDETMMQHCVVCGKVITDYSNVMWPAGQNAPAGFRAGEVFTNDFCTTLAITQETDFVDCQDVLSPPSYGELIV